MINSKNITYWNIVKGVSIASVVISHSCYFLVRFTALYNLIIFFFVAGYLYSEKKYGDNPDVNFLTKIKKNWIKYSGFCMFFVLLHNLLFRYGIIINTEKYYVPQIIKNVLNSLFFSTEEDMCGALWFVPVLIVSMSLFGIIIYISRKIENDKKNCKKNLFIILASILFGFVGLYLTYKKISLIFHTETALLVMPFITIAYFVRTYVKDINKILKVWIFIPVTVILAVFAFKYDFQINLSYHKIGEFYFFYMLSLFGIYFCLYISKYICKIKYINKYFEFLGKYSFEIMACHFLVIKLIDFVYAIIKGISDPMVYGVFPYAFKNLWPLYVVLGCTIPALFFIMINKIKKRILGKICKK